MSYLEKAVAETLAKNGYFLKGDTVSSVAEYIEAENASSKELYTPAEWLKDTIKNYPQRLISVRDVMDNAVNLLIEQNEECLDQTGRLPNVEDYVLECESDEFVDKVGYPLSFEELVRLLLNYYNHKELL